MINETRKFMFIANIIKSQASLIFFFEKLFNFSAYNDIMIFDKHNNVFDTRHNNICLRFGCQRL